MSETAGTSNDSTTVTTIDTDDTVEEKKKTDSQLSTATESGVVDPPNGDPDDPNTNPPGGSA